MISDVILSAIISFAGVWIGGKNVSNTQKKITEQTAERQRKSIEATFYSEIYAILRLVEMRNYERIFDHTLSYIKQYKGYPVHDSFLKMKFDVYHLVYKNHIQDIGTMSPETAANITNFYIVMFSLLEDAIAIPGSVMKNATQMCKTMPGSDVNQIYIANLASLLKSDYIMLYELIDTGKKICKSISKDLGISYIPVFEYIKTPTELKEKLNKDYPDGFWER